MTLPQLHYYMKNCHEDIAFSVKVYGNPMNHMFRRNDGDADSSGDGDGYRPDEYKEATAEDMQWLASIL